MEGLLPNSARSWGLRSTDPAGEPRLPPWVQTVDRLAQLSSYQGTVAESALTTRPTTAGEKLRAIDRDLGVMVSPLHPPTSPVFEHTRKRQAYGTVAPHSVPPIRHQPPSTNDEWVVECRQRWYKKFAEEREANAYTQKISGILPVTKRDIGASGEHGHQEEGELNGFHWQSWRGWHKTARHRHEGKMREVWQEEARQRWRSQVPRSEWKNGAMTGTNPRDMP
eukprot:TRINITY_DN58683_c0_g1_i1.p1 TRINITY_DN58683_c0_g1~~TRINITY_DN58683_c0_g1_i1.p1  ORF type:complete len:247 (-),score=35.63 TRINITY_DN58683_c0_g1_i1:47-715(-)